MTNKNNRNGFSNSKVVIFSLYGHNFCTYPKGMQDVAGLHIIKTICREVISHLNVIIADLMKGTERTNS